MLLYDGIQRLINFLVSALIIFICQTEDAGDRPTGHYDEFGFMVEGGK